MAERPWRFKSSLGHHFLSSFLFIFSPIFTPFPTHWYQQLYWPAFDKRHSSAYSFSQVIMSFYEIATVRRGGGCKILEASRVVARYSHPLPTRGPHLVSV